MFHGTLLLLRCKKNSTIQSFTHQGSWYPNPSYPFNICANNYMRNFSCRNEDPTALSERQNEANFWVLIGFRLLFKCKWTEELEGRERHKKYYSLVFAEKKMEVIQKHKTDAQSHWQLEKLKFEPHTILFHTRKLGKNKKYENSK